MKKSELVDKFSDLYDAAQDLESKLQYALRDIRDIVSELENMPSERNEIEDDEEKVD